MLYGPGNSIYLIPTHEGENTFLFKPLTPKSDYEPFFHISIAHETNMGSISVSGQLPTYPSPKPTLTLTCCQLTVVELRRVGWVVAQILVLIPNMEVMRVMEMISPTKDALDC